MEEQNNFMHLSLPLIYTGIPKLHGSGKRNERTEKNKSNRVSHGAYIKRRTHELSHFWKERREKSIKEGMPAIEVGIPVLLEIDPDADIEFLRGLGFEIVCDVENGYIIVATEDINFSTLNKKAEECINNVSSRCNTPAKI